MRGEAQVGAGQSVDARLYTLTLIYDAISDKRVASLRMLMRGFPYALHIPGGGRGPPVVKAVNISFHPSAGGALRL